MGDVIMLEYFILVFLTKFVNQQVVLLVIPEKSKPRFRMVISYESVLNKNFVRQSFEYYQIHYHPHEFRVEL